MRSITDSSDPPRPPPRVGQFQIAPRGRVDLHDAVLRFALGGCSSGRLPFCVISRYSINAPMRRDFGAGERAERIQRADLEQIAQPLFAAGAVKGRAAKPRQMRPNQRRFRAIALFRLGHDQLAGASRASSGPSRTAASGMT